MTDRVQNVWLDPERVAGFAGPDAQAIFCLDRLAGGAAREDRAGGVRIGGFFPRDPAQHEALLVRRVARIEGDAVGHVLNSVAIEVDLELVHAFRMIAGHGYGAGDRVTDVDHEYGAGLAPEQIKVRDVEADILAGDRRVKMMGHNAFAP